MATKKEKTAAAASANEEQSELGFLSKLIVDYWDFVEESTPTVLKTVDNAVNVWLEVSKTGLEFQSKLLERAGLERGLIQEGTTVAHRVLEGLAEVQKTSSNTALETTTKASRIMRDAVRKRDSDKQDEV